MRTNSAAVSLQCYRGALPSKHGDTYSGAAFSHSDRNHPVVIIGILHSGPKTAFIRVMGRALEVNLDIRPIEIGYHCSGPRFV